MTGPLAQTRARLDAVDEALVGLLAERAQLVAGLATWKSSEGLAFRDPARERESLDRIEARARALGLDGAAIRRLFEGVVGQRLDARAGDTR